MDKEEIKKVIKSIFQKYMCHEKIDMNVTKELYEYLKYQKLDMVFLTLNQNMGKSAETFEWKEREVRELNSLYKYEIESIISKLEERGIPYVILKGWACLISLYQNFTDRYFGDVDILVRENDLDIIEEILLAEGYIYGQTYDNKIIQPDRGVIVFQRCFTHELYNMVKKVNESFVNIDINFKFSWRGVSNTKINDISYDDVKDGTEVIKYDNREYNIFNVNMQFVHLCCHFYNEACYFALEKEFDGGDPKELCLFRLMDICLLLSKVDITEIEKISKRLECIECIDYVVNIICIIMGNNFIENIFPWKVKSKNLNRYIGRDKEWHEWPISFDDRLFDLKKKENMCAKLFPKENVKGESGFNS